MGDDIRLFNQYAKGRCRDKFLAMKHICGLSDLQYDILVEKWCSGRVGMTRIEIAEKHHDQRGHWTENMPTQGRRFFMRVENMSRKVSGVGSSLIWTRR